MPGKRRYTRSERRNPRQRIAIAISKHCAKPKNRRTKVCVLHFKLKGKR